MKAILDKAFGYQGNPKNLPVPDLAAALPFYENVLGFTVKSQSESPHRSVVLTRDHVEIGLAENGGDPTQDGCAFHVAGLQLLLGEFKMRGLQKSSQTSTSSAATTVRGTSSTSSLPTVCATGSASASLMDPHLRET